MLWCTVRAPQRPGGLPLFRRQIEALPVDVCKQVSQGAGKHEASHRCPKRFFVFWGGNSSKVAENLYVHLGRTERQWAGACLCRISCVVWAISGLILKNASPDNACGHAICANWLVGSGQGAGAWRS